MILVDTNVVSEFTRERPSEAVQRWLKFLPARQLFVSSITEAEMLLGVQIMAPSTRRDELDAQVRAIFDSDFAGRVLPFDSAAAREFAAISAERRRIGKEIKLPDAQIAAIVRAHGATLATRNVGDFEHCGIEIVNPWTA